MHHMRDFRDAKAMAQTLREALIAKSVSLTHSESMELIANILGFRDWNVLAARIQSASRSPVTVSGTATREALASTAPQADVDHSGQPPRKEIAVETAILDNYVGFYQLNDGAVFTITRGENHLVTQITGQPPVPIYAESNTEFFAKVVDAQISFVSDAKGLATSLMLHQGGGQTPMPRIDAAKAQQIANRTVEKVKSQSASPGTETALRRL
jgi:hypothetical protein